MSNQAQDNQRGFADRLLGVFRNHHSPSVRRRPARVRHQQSVGTAVEPGRPLSKDERRARHDSVQEEAGFLQGLPELETRRGSPAVPPAWQYNPESFRDVFGRAFNSSITNMISWPWPDQAVLSDEAQVLEDGVRECLETLPDVSTILAIHSTWPSRFGRITSSLITFLFFFTLVFGALWALTDNLLTKTRVEANCTPTTVYVPYTTTITALSTPLDSADSISVANEAPNTSTTTRTTTITQTDAITVFVTPDAQPVSVLSSSGGASYFFQEVSGTTSWINGISPPSTESLTYGATTLFISPVYGTPSEIDPTITVQTTSTRYGTTTITITPPVYTSTTYSVESAISTSTMYMTTTETIQVSQVSIESRSSFGGIGSSGWNVTSVAVDNVAASGGVGSIGTGVPATVTGTFYFGTGDLTTSTSTGLLTTTLTSRITQTNFITATIPITAVPESSAQPSTSSNDPVSIGISSSFGSIGLPLPPAANETLSLTPIRSPLAVPQTASASSTEFPTIIPGSYGILPSASMSATAPVPSDTIPTASEELLSPVLSIGSQSSFTLLPASDSFSEAPSSSVTSLSAGSSLSSNSTAASIAPNNTGSSISSISGSPLPSSFGQAPDVSATQAPSNLTDSSITGSVTILPIFPSTTRTVTLPSDSAASASSFLAESSLTGADGTASSAPSADGSPTADAATENTSQSTTSFRFVSEPPTAASSIPATDSASSSGSLSQSVPIGTGTVASVSPSATGSGVDSISSQPLALSAPDRATPASSSAPATLSFTSSVLASSNSPLDSSSAISSTPITASFTSTRITATASSATATPTICGTDNGNFTLDWDDLGTFTPTRNDTDITGAPPVRQPYHHLAFSNGYVYSPAPDEPFVPRSEPHLLVFLANNTANPSTGRGGSIRPGEIGGGSVDNNPAFWFNAYRAWLGCDNEGPSDCTLVMTAYSWDISSQSERTLGSSNATLAPCEALADCQLQPVEFPDGWDNLSGLQIRAFVDGGERMFFMDDLDMGWSNNTCEAGLARSRGGRNRPGVLRMIKW